MTELGNIPLDTEVPTTADLLVPDGTTLEESGGQIRVKDAGVSSPKLSIGTPSNDDVIQRKAGAWTNRTLAQFAADLGVVPADTLTPGDIGLLAWTLPWYSPTASPGGLAPGSQDVWAMRFRNPITQTIASVVGNLAQAGTSFGGNGAKFAIFSNDGATRLFVTADISGSLGATGDKTLAFASSGSLPAGTYWLAFWAQSTGTMPRFKGLPNAIQAPFSAANGIVFRAATGQTDMPSSITPNTNGGTTSPWILGLT
jgi:hypothetical protein